MVDLADSLSAIRTLVFDEKRVTMKELKGALKADFEGFGELRRMCLEAPKYGNADDFADQMVRQWYRLFEEEHRKHKDHLGNELRPIALSVTTHFPFGARVGALPSGRKAGVPLADGSVSASPGMDKKGPTALIRSAANALDGVRYGCNLLNMKFHPTVLKDNSGLRKLISLIKTYFDLGGHHVQFNVVSADTLRDAQRHPKKYRNLIVRVAGFSAFFIHLNPIVQNEIIKRTEITL
jgi:formate C-acetyltransferase